MNTTQKTPRLKQPASSLDRTGCNAQPVDRPNARHVPRRRDRPSRAPARGFTITEMLATVSVMVILMSVAAGSFNSTMSNNRVYGAQSELLASMALAKSEAMRRGLPVVVTALAPMTGNEFGGGWTIWVDTNGNGALEEGEPILRTHEALPSSVTITTGGATSVRYGTLGFLVPAASFGAAVCPAHVGTPGNGFVVSIGPNGMADVAPSPSC